MLSYWYNDYHRIIQLLPELIEPFTSAYSFIFSSNAYQHASSFLHLKKPSFSLVTHQLTNIFHLPWYITATVLQPRIHHGRIHLEGELQFSSSSFNPLTD